MAERIRRLLKNVRSGKVPVDKAIDSLKSLPYHDMGFAKIDCHRALRRGFPEVVFGQGKTISQVAMISKKIVAHDGVLLVTRASKEAYRAVKKICRGARYNELGRVIYYRKDPVVLKKGLVLIISAGTADLPVAEEARVTCELMGNLVETLYDVGVAGIHRLLNHKHLIDKASVIIVVAGMEGALASVVSGLVSRPVVAVPTSVGYGASFEGLAPLLTMMNSCSPGVAVVNIDNGFGAGYLAGLINS